MAKGAPPSSPLPPRWECGYLVAITHYPLLPCRDCLLCVELSTHKKLSIKMATNVYPSHSHPHIIVVHKYIRSHSRCLFTFFKHYLHSYSFSIILKQNQFLLWRPRMSLLLFFCSNKKERKWAHIFLHVFYMTA